MAANFTTIVSTPISARPDLHAAAQGRRSTAVCAITRQGRQEFAFPHEARLIGHTYRCKRVRPANFFASAFLPIVHQVDAWRWFGPHGQFDATDAHHYYYARGCSDMHIRVSPRKTMVATNRVDAAVRLLALKRHISVEKADRVFIKLAESVQPNWAAPVCNLTGVALVRRIRTLDVCSYPWLRRADEWGQSSCLHLWKKYGSLWVGTLVIELMQQVRMHTVVLLHEAPGAASDLRHWKTEVVRARPFQNETLYDAAGSRCTPQLDVQNCAYCTGSPLTQRACGVVV